MKKNILIAFLFIISQSLFGQRVSVKVFSGKGMETSYYLSHLPSDRDSNSYEILESDNSFFWRPAISYTFENNDFLEISGIVNRNSNMQSGSRIDTSSIFSPNNFFQILLCRQLQLNTKVFMPLTACGVKISTVTI